MAKFCEKHMISWTDETQACPECTAKVIPKPLGFDLRNARSDKSDKPYDWTPADALYDASLAHKEVNVEQLIVLWWETIPGDPENRQLKFRNATLSAAEFTNILWVALKAL